MISNTPFLVVRVLSCVLAFALAMAVVVCGCVKETNAPASVLPAPLPVTEVTAPSVPFVPPEPLVRQSGLDESYKELLVLTPVKIAESIRSIAAGRGFNVYVTRAGELYALGVGRQRDFVGGGESVVYTPTLIATGVRAVAAGDSHCLFLKEDGTLYGIGSNVFGELGQRKGDLYSSPVKIAEHVSRIAASGYVSLYITDDGVLCGMGLSHCGQLGLVPDVKEHPILCSGGIVRIAGNVVDCAVGNNHILFIKRNGDLYGMGANDYSQLVFDGFHRDISSPFRRRWTGKPRNHFAVTMDIRLSNGFMFCPRVEGTSQICSKATFIICNVAKVAAGDNFSVFLTRSGDAYTMGYDCFGANWERTPSFGCGKKGPLRFATGVKEIAAGYSYMMYIMSDGSLYNVGTNTFGQLGNGMQGYTKEPCKVATDVVKAAVGFTNAYFITSDGTLYGMGAGDMGLLGADYSSYVTDK